MRSINEIVEKAKSELLESCEYVGDMDQRQGDVLRAFSKMEQEIAELVGEPNKLTVEQVSKIVYKHIKFYEGGEVDEYAITDELNAMLDESDAIAFCKRVEKAVEQREPLTLFGVDYFTTAGEECDKVCHLDETERYLSERGIVHVLECSECGHTCEHVNGSYPLCPHCGREVVER